MSEELIARLDETLDRLRESTSWAEFEMGYRRPWHVLTKIAQAGGDPRTAELRALQKRHRTFEKARALITKIFRLKPGKGRSRLSERVSLKKAKEVGDSLGVDWKKVSLAQLQKGIEVEGEHQTGDPKTDVVKGKNPLKTQAKIALAHIRELPDYYTRLAKMEKHHEDRETEERKSGIAYRRTIPKAGARSRRVIAWPKKGTGIHGNENA
jgi:hypothetical protein